MPSPGFKGWVALAITLCSLLIGPRAAQAQQPPTRVSVLTMGPGAHPFTRFGHNALLLEWDTPAGKSDAVYNFGTFEFDGVQGAMDFMAGRFRYWLSVGSLEGTLRAYGEANRSLSAQELELTLRERAELLAALTNNALPEHRYYDYDYYRDNCSTRVRDALDRVLGGELRRAVVGPGRLSFRQHTLRLVGDAPWLYLGLDLALGAPTDQPTTRWEELFLPRQLHDALQRMTRPLGGTQVPLVRGERALLPAASAAEPLDPPERRLAFLAWGSLLGACLAGLGWGAAHSRALRVAFGTLSALLGTSIGLLGSALCIFAASKHWAAHANRSLLACPPWALALGVLGVALVWGSARAISAMRVVLSGSLLTSLVLLLLSFSQSGRESLRVVALFLPLWAGWLAGVWLAQPRRSAAAQAIARAGGGALLGGRAGD